MDETTIVEVENESEVVETVEYNLPTTSVSERLKSPVFWAATLAGIIGIVEAADLSTPRNILLVILSILLCILNGYNNPTDRDHF